MRLFPLIPVGRINSYGSTERANIFFERIIFNYHHIFIPWYVYQAEPLILFEKAIDLSSWFPLWKLKWLSEEELAELIDLVARSKLQFLGVWGITVGVDRVEGRLGFAPV